MHAQIIGTDVQHHREIMASSSLQVPRHTGDETYFHLAERPSSCQTPKPCCRDILREHAAVVDSKARGESLWLIALAYISHCSYSSSCVSRWPARPPAAPPSPHSKSCIHNALIYLPFAVSKETGELKTKVSAVRACRLILIFP